MSKLESIAVTTEIATGNVLPLMHEIRHALSRLLETGEARVIDLRSIPLAPGEEQKILDTLGQGEVCVQLNALGSSTIQETIYPGVWLVTHENTAGEIMGRYIEVTRMPDIIAAQEADIRAGMHSLAERLGETGA